MFSAISLFIMVSGAGLLGLALMQRQKSLEAALWPKTQAIIRSSGVVVHPAAGGDGTTYEAAVQYDYEVDGRTYHGTCISNGLAADHSRLYPGGLMLRYAAGSVAQVHHHPTDHGRAVLEVRSWGAGLAAAVLGMLLVFAGGAALARTVLQSWVVSP